MATSSRYKTSYAQDATTTISVRSSTYPTRYTYHVSSDGESFESIATWAFGDPERWWEIADINSQVRYPNFIPTGTIIRIPSS
jgi:hypothetical protein